MSYKVQISGDFVSPSGYSKATRAHAKALIVSGVDVIFENKKFDPTTIELDPWWKAEYSMRSNRKERADIKIFHHTPDLAQPGPAHINIAMVPWETSRLPDIDLLNQSKYNWVKQLNKMDLVWTFAKSSKEAMLSSGVTVPIEVLAHPIDPSLCYYTPKDMTTEIFDQNRQPLHKGWFKFLSIFQYIPRKDPVSLLVAYLSEFTADENVVLILKTYHTNVGDLDSIKKNIAELKSKIKLPHRAPRVVLVPGVLTDSQIGDLMRASDCSVVTSHGEGFALNAIESVAVGTPAIVPNGSCFPDHIDESRGYLVKTHTEPVHGISHSPWYSCDQSWHRIDILDLKKRMREAYTDRKGLTDRAENGVRYSKCLYPAKIGQIMKESLESLLVKRL